VLVFGSTNPYINRKGIPYRLVGAQKFYMRKEIKDAMAFLTILGNPHSTSSLQR